MTTADDTPPAPAPKPKPRERGPRLVYLVIDPEGGPTLTMYSVKEQAMEAALERRHLYQAVPFGEPLNLAKVLEA